MLVARFPVLATVFLTACTSIPTLKEVQASKPPVFKSEVAATPDSCGKMPPIPVDLALDGFYIDMKGGSYSVMDPKLFNEWKETFKPLETWNRELNKRADEYSMKKNVESGKCAVSFLDEWARENALLGEIKKMPHEPRQSYYHQQWLFAAATSIYFKVQDLATPEQDARIKWWLSQVSLHIKKFWTGDARRNNHYAWGAVGVMQLGVLTNNKEDIDFARKAFNHLTDAVRSDGFLTTEIWRGQRAMFYHNFTLQPLCYMAQLSKLVGENWWTNEKFQQLMSTVNDATFDISLANKAANAAQEGFRPDEWGWYGVLPDNDPRRVKLIEFMKKTRVAWKSGDGFIIKNIPDSKELGGNQEAFRDLVEKRVAEKKIR
jgi:poly(beta-D-mannuronate) lyase